MRVISGRARGTKLNSIEDISTRPTLDRVKESLFNILQEKIRNKVVLDLFAGSGALGIEALSRGTRKAYFCDVNKESIKFIKSNLQKTNFIDQAIILNEDYKKCILELNEKVDIIFIDPPYKADIGVNSIKLIIENNILSKEGIIVLETDEKIRDEEEIKKISNITIYDARKYGRVNLLFIKCG